LKSCSIPRLAAELLEITHEGELVRRCHNASAVNAHGEIALHIVVSIEEYWTRYACGGRLSAVAASQPVANRAPVRARVGTPHPRRTDCLDD